MERPSLVLLGDSILDNALYARPLPDSTAHLQRLLPDWAVVRLARDGSLMADVYSQLRSLNSRPTTAVLSVGGNDAIVHIGLLNKPASNSAAVLGELFAVVEEFGRQYEALARAVAERADRTLVCTIYEVQLKPEYQARLARVPLGLLNDRIVRTAAHLGLDVLDLRSVCTEPGDFALQIEPSAQGAEKIAGAIAAVLGDGHTLKSGRVFG